MGDQRLLIIDDEPEVCESIRKLAERQGIEVFTITTPREFLTAVESFQPTVIMIDIVMPETDGVELLKLLAKRGCDARVVMMTGYREGYLLKAVELGRGLGLKSISGLLKPLRLADLKEAFSSMLPARRPAPAA